VTKVPVWLLCVLVALAASLPYLRTVNDYFAQDDFGVVQLLAAKPWSTFPQWFTMPWMEQIWGYTPDELRPFVAFTYQVTALPGAGRPEFHHVVNIAMHAGNALLVMAMARVGMGLSPYAAACAGVMFALLPVQAESVAWITGRVDSMPTLFYFAAFLSYMRWRTDSKGAGPWYALALALFFVALFSKQNTITMVATLATYDLVVLDRSRRGSLLACVRAWSPFAVMTIGFLLLRRLRFGASLRGGLGSVDQVMAALEMIGRHLLRTVFGHDGPVAMWEIAVLLAVVCIVIALVLRNATYLRLAFVFGVAWWAIGIAPVFLAGYESTRHVYLASAGWALLLGLVYEAVERHMSPRSRTWQAVTIAAAVLIAGGYAVRLGAVVDTWGRWASVSKLAVERVGQEAAQVPEGTLLLVSVPRRSWDWATPFALQPPYTATDVSSRVNLVTPYSLNCCGYEQWNVSTRASLVRWARTGAPVVALHVSESGAVSRLTDRENPDLRAVSRILVRTDSWQTLDSAIVRLMEQLVRRVQ
jgi:hypothetical protein